MNCLAKVPLYVLLVGAFFPGHASTAMFFISTVTLFMALPIARLLSGTLLVGLDSAPFIMEMPPYHMPTLRNLLTRAVEKVALFIQKIVTVVAGLPRTGTSMMMQMLVAGGLVPLTDGKRVADADNPRGYLEYEPATRLRDDASWVPQAKGKVVKIVAQLLPFLPPPLHYRIIFMHRNLQEVLASQQTMLERQGKAKGTLGPAELAAVLDRQAGDVARVMAARPHVRVLHLDYREVVRRPAEAARRLNVFLGGKLNLDAMVAAVDPALHRQKDRSA